MTTEPTTTENTTSDPAQDNADLAEDPRDTGHPAGEQQAEENRDDDPPG